MSSTTPNTTESPAPARRAIPWTAWILLAIAVGYLLFPASLWDKLALIPFAIDPQRPGHSFFLGGIQMPIEARKTGMYGGFLIALVVFWVRRRGRAGQYPNTFITLLSLALASTLVFDGINAVLYDLYLPHLYPPNLYLRLGTGLLTGLALAAFVPAAFNQTVWRQPQPSAALPNLRAYLEVLLAFVPFYLLLFSGWGPLLYPLSTIPILGLLILVLMMGVTFVTPFMRREKKATRLLDLADATLIALILIVLFFGFMSLVRFIAFSWGPMPELR